MTAEASSIPIVDFGGWGSKALVDDRASIAARLTNHSVSLERLAEAFNWSKKLFDLKLEQKMLAPHPSGHAVHRGYSWSGLEKVSNAMGDETDAEELKQNLRQISDVKESYEIGSESNKDQPNQWISKVVLPGFRDFMEGFYRDCHQAAMSI